jgi:hypothetical protein
MKWELRKGIIRAQAALDSVREDVARRIYGKNS